MRADTANTAHSFTASQFHGCICAFRYNRMDVIDNKCYRLEMPGAFWRFLAVSGAMRTLLRTSSWSWLIASGTLGTPIYTSSSNFSRFNDLEGKGQREVLLHHRVSP